MNGMRRNLSIALSFQLSDNFVEALLIVFTVPLLPSSLGFKKEKEKRKYISHYLPF